MLTVLEGGYCGHGVSRGATLRILDLLQVPRKLMTTADASKKANQRLEKLLDELKEVIAGVKQIIETNNTAGTVAAAPATAPAAPGAEPAPVT